PWQTDPSLASDRLHNFYVVWSEHRTDNSAGAIRIQKFNFSSGSPSSVNLSNTPNGVLYQWAATSAAASDPALNPSVAVDTFVGNNGSLNTFTDPITGVTQTDPLIPTSGSNAGPRAGH